MHDDEALAAYQEALLALFHREISVDAALEALATGGAFAPFRAEIRRFDRRSVEVAMELVKKWGVPTPR